MSIRWLIRRDMDEILEIERTAFCVPWTESDFLECLRAQRVIGTIIEDESNQIAGYLLYELRDRSFHLIRLAIARSWRRNGLGTALIAKIRGKLSPSQRSAITIDVPDSNTGAHLFLQSCGFRAIRVIRGNPDVYAFRMTVFDNKTQEKTAA